jgi:hypothetical protein
MQEKKVLMFMNTFFRNAFRRFEAAQPCTGKDAELNSRR